MQSSTDNGGYPAADSVDDVEEQLRVGIGDSYVSYKGR